MNFVQLLRISNPFGMPGLTTIASDILAGSRNRSQVSSLGAPKPGPRQKRRCVSEKHQAQSQAPRESLQINRKTGTTNQPKWLVWFGGVVWCFRAPLLHTGNSGDSNGFWLAFLLDCFGSPFSFFLMFGFLAHVSVWLLFWDGFRALENPDTIDQPTPPKSPTQFAGPMWAEPRTPGNRLSGLGKCEPLGTSVHETPRNTFSSFWGEGVLPLGKKKKLWRETRKHTPPGEFLVFNQ